MATASELDMLRSRLETLLGQPVWSAVAGPRGDWVLSLELGEQSRRSMRLANPRLGFLKQTYEGSHGLLVECPWRLDAEDRVITCAFDYLDVDRPPGSRLGELEEQTVEAVEVRGPAADLELRLSGGLWLRSFSAEGNLRGKRANWSLWTPDGAVVVGPRGRVEGGDAPEPEPPTLRLRQRLRALEDED